LRRFVGISAPTTRGATDALDRLDVEPKPSQRADHKRPVGQLVLQRWVAPHDPAAALHRETVAVDLLA
jgi:hypothetical protein